MRVTGVEGEVQAYSAAWPGIAHKSLPRAVASDSVHARRERFVSGSCQRWWTSSISAARINGSASSVLGVEGMSDWMRAPVATEARDQRTQVR
jgi:hypothetical protein